MAAGWWGLGRGGGGPRGGFGHLGEGDGAVEVRVGAVAALLPAELGVEQVAAEAQHDEVGRTREVPLDRARQLIAGGAVDEALVGQARRDRKSTRLNSSH